MYAFAKGYAFANLGLSGFSVFSTQKVILSDYACPLPIGLIVMMLNVLAWLVFTRKLDVKILFLYFMS